MGQTLFEKVWNRHVVVQDPGAPAVLYVDAHLVHEVTSPQAFAMLRQRGLRVRRPERTFATMDHAIPTRPMRMMDIALWPADAAHQVRTLRENCAEFGVTLFDIESETQGIVHVIGPELGITQPGMTIVCGDSHTSTHGAFGALAFGIGTSEVGYVLATQCLLQSKPKTFAVNVEGTLAPGVTAKDIILAIIRQVGVGGGTGHVFEYRGALIRSLSMEQRMTICNMSIEGGARAGMIAPDETTFAYLAGRPLAPEGADFDVLVARERVELERRERAFRGGRPALQLHQRTAILIDDGVATGSTMLAAVRAARQGGAAEIIAAAPVSSHEALALLEPECDAVEFLMVPPALYAIGQWYQDFTQTPDSEVTRLLALKTT